MSTYVAEEFSADEADVLRRYFTNLDQPVFALVNLPEVVKGALFARYSRSEKSLRRLFLEEFVGELDVSGDETIDATVGLRRAEELYDRVFFEFGDDSVAQLGGVHLACEQASNLLTKVLEWGRMMSYLEQSTRYIAYDLRLGGRYRYYRDPEILSSPLGARYISDMDRLFENYAEMVPLMVNHFRAKTPKVERDSDFVYRQALAAKAFDSVRGMLPAASLSNVGIYASGQAYEALLVRMRAHPLPEARTYAEMMLTELRKVIPSFLKRVDLPDRGAAVGAYGIDCRERVADIADELFPSGEPIDDVKLVDLTDFDPDAEVKLVAAVLYPFTNRPDRRVEDRVGAMTVAERLSVLKAFVGDRSNRRHRPGRALERPSYRFDILSDYGAFRDLQRHRMMTLDWQRLSTTHGYVRPPEVDAAGFTDQFDASMNRSAALHDALQPAFPDQASYAASLAHRVRYMMQMNAREAMHVLELRTSPQGHPAYREVCQQMHTLIRDVAGHRAIAEMMVFVDHSSGTDLERLDSERRSEQKRVQAVDTSDSSIG
ncbi:MAG TPA: thymidylate synthase [Acidimicrobiaceae bacterium]|nr:thymidylate synthase [Acidobacteriota bacterium]HCV36130.1 thymidylate synthase [Acidimicrobiaceae bacterium]HJO79595.1 FAD-dependent thymidylate synthase [Acidimicrobiales bacterium]